MIHHISIAANNPRHVAEVLAKLLGGKVAPFTPHPGSYVAVAMDEQGTLIEVYPLGTELIPGDGEQQVKFRENKNSSQFDAVHAAVSVPVSQKEIEEIGASEGWRVLHCNRGKFEVIEFWIENRLMIELLSPEIVSQYLNFIHKKNLEKLFSTTVG
ncbi:MULTISPECIES: hypothetical protein [Nostoc]|uniref:VOC domain-containing protein n=1 Tax=Nostoc paludosum FACHB-159 TaxID=2692908 RepID=A0ABR8K5E3_9NOSO|nr:MULTISPECIES: hypothetical protein [Nostoc]MBD2678269.1 hypothetical protein [Nostoc sp. FACHB-857]MBD2733387.1 hypothetical protein [Nostoc paludosum FACHB-159]